MYNDLALFTDAILHGIGFHTSSQTLSEVMPADKNLDGFLTLDELYQYCCWFVTEDFGQDEQHPQIYNNSSSLVLFDNTNIKKKSQIISVDKSKYIFKKKTVHKKYAFHLAADTLDHSELKYQISETPKNCRKYISVNKAGKVVLKGGIKKGKYEILISSDETKEYIHSEKIVTVKIE